MEELTDSNFGELCSTEKLQPCYL